MTRNRIWSLVHLVVAGIFLAMMGAVSCQQDTGGGGPKDETAPKSGC